MEVGERKVEKVAGTEIDSSLEKRIEQGHVETSETDRSPREGSG